MDATVENKLLHYVFYVKEHACSDYDYSKMSIFFLVQ